MTEKGWKVTSPANPAKIIWNGRLRLLKNGLGYVSTPYESVDDLGIRMSGVRPPISPNPTRNILKLMDLKAQRNYTTEIVITMNNLTQPWQEDEFERLQEAFDGCDVYVYLKSQDQMWYEDNQQQTQSIHWMEFFQFLDLDGPSSPMVNALSVWKFNNEIILGDTHTESLYDIWNGRKYADSESAFDLKPAINARSSAI